MSETVQYPPRQWGDVVHRQRDGLFPPECACGLPWPCPVTERDELRAEVERLKFIANDRSGEQQYQRIEKRAEKAEAALREIRGIALGLGAAGIAGHVDILGIVEIALHDAAPAEQPEAGEP